LLGRSKSHRNVKPIENPTAGELAAIDGLGEFAGPIANDSHPLVSLDPLMHQKMI
jgi:hypothetical protein